MVASNLTNSAFKEGTYLQVCDVRRYGSLRSQNWLLAYDDGMAKGPHIYYHCYDSLEPSGGQKSTYQHVDRLNSLGFEAAVVHTHLTDRLSWFENNTRVVTWNEFRAGFDFQHDFLVMPEDLGGEIRNFPGNKVIFNKNVYYGCACNLGTQSEYDPYCDPCVKAAFAVSRHNEGVLKFAYPDLTVIRMVEAIDSELFSYRGLGEKRHQIAFGGKNPLQVATIKSILRARERAHGETTYVTLENYSEREVASILQESLLFVFCGVDEGLGRLPLEAMACGCVPLFYDAGPIGEYACGESLFRYGDVVNLVGQLERVLTAHATGACAQYQPLADAGRKQAEQFSQSAQDETLLSAWKALLH
jgi:glycosyltransferase involved in cell wall biosynthesis